MSKPKLPLLELLYAALNARIGVLVETNDVGRLQQRLYAERKVDPDLANLILKPDPARPDTHLFIIRKSNERGSEETHPEPSGG